MFECLVGWPPFCADNRQDVYRKIVNFSSSLYFPDDVQVTSYSEHLIRRSAHSPPLSPLHPHSPNTNPLPPPAS